MHVVFRESHGLEETETPFDLQQDPADLVVLSYSDSDLGAFSAGWQRGKDTLPSLRLANLVALRHPLSIDTYLEKTLSHARGILVRLIGGESYWSYGLMQLQDLCRRNAIALAVLPADGRRDERLEALSTLPVGTLHRLTALCDAGGAVAAQAALAQLALAAGLYAAPVFGDKTIPNHGWYDPDHGPIKDLPQCNKPLFVISFYRSYVTSADTGPIDALLHEARAQGFDAYGLFAPSLKGPHAAPIADMLHSAQPAAIINATAFSAKSDQGLSPLDHTGCPVWQVALSTARHKDWQEAERGLSPADLAMHIVLPEVDGRLFAGVVSFKSPTKHDPDTQFSRFIHRAFPAGIKAAIGKVAARYRLCQTDAAQRKVTVVLSTYPNKDYNLAHAVGLDALASCSAIMAELAPDCAAPPDLGHHLQSSRLNWPIDAYQTALAALPETLQQALHKAWGAPDRDPACKNGAFHFQALRHGNHLIALQPERGEVATRDGEYHDLSRTPRHFYVAFYLWLHAQKMDALIHMGAHGTLEWLPGKAVALGAECWPQALVQDMPVIYPFIVNDPGEAAQAKRRITALTLGHMPPPMVHSALPPALLHLERLLDEYSTADGLDPARRDRLIAAIRDEAQAAGVEADLALPQSASAAEAITRIDRFVCDIKESQYGHGLHIYGQGAGEMAGLHRALNGLHVEPGPSGSPYRGRGDVVPTGRNLFAVDPRSVPTRAAFAQGVKLAEELLRRHLQDQGDYPRHLVIDLWGSATMRTAGEEFAMALHLAGLAPLWDGQSERVNGFEIIPLALLARPRIDVTLRISGLFRDVFPGLAQMFDSAAQALALRDETAEDNPYLARSPRVFGPKPGQFGMAMEGHLTDFSPESRKKAGEAWLKASEWAIDAQGNSRLERTALEQRVISADGFAHIQDLAETDLLLAADYSAHEGGFAAAVAALGGDAAPIYHMDSTNPAAPRARLLNEELARIIRARAANPNWADGMMKHGFRGGAEIAATLDHLAAFAHLTRAVPHHLFDLYFDATLGRPDLVAFLAAENPQALAALQQQFYSLYCSGLWHTKRNSILADLDMPLREASQ